MMSDKGGVITLIFGFSYRYSLNDKCDVTIGMTLVGGRIYRSTKGARPGPVWRLYWTNQKKYYFRPWGTSRHCYHSKISSNRNNETPELILNDETWLHIVVEKREHSSLELKLERQSHSHHMITGYISHTNQIPEIPNGRLRTQHDALSEEMLQIQSLSRQISEDFTFISIKQILRGRFWNQISIIRLLNWIVVRERPQTVLKPASTSTLVFDGKNSYRFFNCWNSIMVKNKLAKRNSVFAIRLKNNINLGLIQTG